MTFDPNQKRGHAKNKGSWSANENGAPERPLGEGAPVYDHDAPLHERLHALRNDSLDSESLSYAAKHERTTEALTAVATHQNTDGESLAEVWSSRPTDMAVLQGLLDNQNTPTAVIDNMRYVKSSDLYHARVNRKRNEEFHLPDASPVEELAEFVGAADAILAAREDQTVSDLSNPDKTAEELDEAVSHYVGGKHQDTVMATALNHPNTNDETLNRIVRRSDGIDTWETVAAHPNASADTVDTVRGWGADALASAQQNHDALSAAGGNVDEAVERIMELEEFVAAVTSAHTAKLAAQE